MEVKETTYKWEDFENKFISSVKESEEDVYAIAINENEASLITLKNGTISMNRYYSNDNSLIVSNSDESFEFDTVRECLTYLRVVREDHANNYEYKNLVKKLISQLYLNDIVDVNDIIS